MMYAIPKIQPIRITRRTAEIASLKLIPLTRQKLIRKHIP